MKQQLELTREPIEHRVQLARQACERLRTEVSVLTAELKLWDEYLTNLENIQRVERELRVVSANGHGDLTKELLVGRPVVELVLYFGYTQPNYEISNKHVGLWLFDIGAYADEKSAQLGANSTLRRKSLFKPLDRGVYRLTTAGVKRAESINQEPRYAKKLLD